MRLKVQFRWQALHRMPEAHVEYRLGFREAARVAAVMRDKRFPPNGIHGPYTLDKRFVLHQSLPMQMWRGFKEGMRLIFPRGPR